MDISFKWGRNVVTPEQKVVIESNICEEVSNLMTRFTGEPTALVVSLAGKDPIFSSIDGRVTATGGETLITFTYSLSHPCTRTYSPLGSYFLDEE